LFSIRAAQDAQDAQAILPIDSSTACCAGAWHGPSRRVIAK
jgi:hypothetical protein